MKKAPLFGILLSFATNKMNCLEVRWSLVRTATYSHTSYLTTMTLLKCSYRRSEISLFIWLETVWTLWLLPNSNSSQNYLSWPRRLHNMANSQTAVELRIILLSFVTASIDNFTDEIVINNALSSEMNRKHSVESNTPAHRAIDPSVPQANNPTITTTTMNWTKPLVMQTHTKKTKKIYIWIIILQY
jgi:hypothetical protein